MVDFKSIDETSNLAGSNKIEVLMFYLSEKDGTGNTPLYGINVFKVRELLTLPKLTKKPNSHECSAGIANIRGKAVPVINLQKYYGIDATRSESSGESQDILVVTEFTGSMQGFIVHEVDKIVQLDWRQIKEPPEVVTHLSGFKQGNTLTGISILDDKEMLMIIDVEQVLADVIGSGRDTISEAKMESAMQRKTVLFADDSRVARAQVRKMLETMGFDYLTAHNGQDALNILEDLAEQAKQSKKPVSDMITAVITDVEMPEMDGYMLTQWIKSDSRFEGIPVMMHSSLSAEETIRLGDKVGVDAYVPKLQPREFSEALNGIIDVRTKKAA